MKTTDTFWQNYKDLNPGATRAAFRRTHASAFSDPQASNTISSTLKPDALVDGLIVAANNRLAPVRAFSTLLTADPVRPGATVQVKRATSGGTGQTNPTSLESGDSVLDPISCTMAHKTQSFNVSIPDRNWSIGLEDLALINAQSFCNLLSDVYTAIMTTANYGAGIAVGVAPTFAFDSLKTVLAGAKNRFDQ